MKIVLCIPEASDQPERWLQEFRNALPAAQLSLWQDGMPAVEADYAIVRKPPATVFAAHPWLKAVFNLGAGIEGLLQLGAVPESMAIVKLDDAGMGQQMVEYILWAVLRYFRRFDVYERNRVEQLWRPLEASRHEDFPIGIMGFGTLGQRAGTALLEQGFHVHGWSRDRKSVNGIRSYAGPSELQSFMAASRILVCMLPMTSDTQGLLNRETLALLPGASYLVNVARGAHVVEQDLLALLDSGHLAGATLDVCRQEPLPQGHAFWSHPKVVLTPHISAQVVRADSIAQIVEKLKRVGPQ